ncbi:MAG: histidine--tRNA ligase [Polyangiaceae bacterium]
MNPLRAVKGMNDVLPDEASAWHRVEKAFATTMALHGYGEIRTPYVEPTALFVRTIGEVTDIVEKEMYSFVHRDEALTLRPEGTASAARAYVEHAVHGGEPVTRWYYMGPMFRAERPQRGRYRQFHQAGAEIFGDPGPGCDAEMIDMLVGFLASIGIADAEVLVNCLGSNDARARYKDALVRYLEPKKADLTDESRKRLETNPLRILDSKSPKDKEAVAQAPPLTEFLDDADRAHFDALRKNLDALGTPYKVDARLVRGLDYYTRTLFEIKGATAILGAGDTLLGGGRYDGMVKELGGPSVPAIGFAAGLERLILASEAAKAKPTVDAVVMPLGENAVGAGLVLGRELRRAGISADVDARGASLKSQLRRANGLGARVALVLGDDEIANGKVQVKDLDGRAQTDVARADVLREVDRIRATPRTPSPGGAS